ncbi:MAG: alkaline phosphatase [Pirellulaceae bacterium]
MPTAIRRLPMKSWSLLPLVLLVLHANGGTTSAQDAPPRSGESATVPQVVSAASIANLPTRIAFGSCAHQDKPQPILRDIVEKQPNLFIYLGDNIYGDTKDMQVLRNKYQKLADKPEFKALRASVATLSVWDDHDYGWDDAGKEYEFKEASKEIFLDFWQVPTDSTRRNHAGIYGVHEFKSSGHVLQVILLDTRTFRDPLKRNPRPLPDGASYEGKQLKNEYQPDPDPNKTLLGSEQWAWLAETLKRPADLRIMCSSIQFGHEYNGWESWTNLPREQRKMVDTIRAAKASGVLFVSGDVHWGEISRRRFDGLYPLYDVTASGITQDWHNTEPNEFRVGNVFRKNHFGMLDIDWNLDDPTITMQIVDVDGSIQVQHSVRMSELKF